MSDALENAILHFQDSHLHVFGFRDGCDFKTDISTADDDQVRSVFHVRSDFVDISNAAKRVYPTGV
ncbi:MAG: hypothetical protein Ct9H300mP8_00070 [Gammaproteobacteria bacterium]|nr:MAG: hypothetical protein Ct9H300mP8_00070 [Gammaproteobacteria bacterium]